MMSYSRPILLLRFVEIKARASILKLSIVITLVMRFLPKDWALKWP